MKFNKNWFEKRWFGYLIAACAAVLLYVVLTRLNVIGRGIAGILRILSPVIFGIVIAYILDPFVRLFENKVFKKIRSEKTRRGLAVLCGVLVVFVLLALLMIAVIPQLVNSIKVLVGNMPDYSKAIEKFIDSLQNKKDGLNLSAVADFLTNGMQRLRDFLASKSDNILQGSLRLGQGFITGIISVILAIYFLADKHRLQRETKKFFAGTTSRKTFHSLGNYWNRCNQILDTYVLYNLVDGIIVGAICAAFMAIVGMPYIALISVIVGVTNLIPTFGPILGGAIGAFLLVLVNPWYALWFLIFVVVEQIFDGYILKPKLYGNTFGVPSLWILVMIIIGARAFGLWGILLAIPLAAILSFTFREYFWPWLKKRRIRKGKEERRGIYRDVELAEAEEAAAAAAEEAAAAAEEAAVVAEEAAAVAAEDAAVAAEEAAAAAVEEAAVAAAESAAEASEEAAAAVAESAVTGGEDKA